MMIKRLLASILYLLLGGGLILAGALNLVDSFWVGMGGGLLAVGAVQCVRQLRYRTNPEYKEAVDTANADERNRFLSMKAWSWAGYLFVFAGALGTILFRVFGQELLSQFCAFSLCLVLVLYWVSYLILRKKY